MNTFEKARNFIYRNARPLELALWKYHFENGSKDEVLQILSFYQNEDGGFAHAVEPDNFNINSNPISTWQATQILYEIDFNDSNHPIIKGILKYLTSGKDFVNNKWLFTIPSNNDYPHAIWWECADSIGEPCDNPTVSLAGFVLKYGDKESKLYLKCREIIKEFTSRFFDDDFSDMHLAKCLLNLLNYACDINSFDLFETEKFKNKLVQVADNAICKETEKWATDYVCKPSNFLDRRCLILNSLNHGLVEYEGKFIIDSQLNDGSFNITWQWHNDYKEFEISEHYWKSIITIRNMLYLKKLGMI